MNLTKCFINIIEL